MRKTGILALCMGLILLFSCKSKNEDQSAESEQAEVATDQADQGVPQSSSKPQPTASKTVAADTPTIPKLQNLRWIDTIETGMGTMYQTLQMQKKVTDSVDYVVFTRGNGVCEFYFVATVMHDTIYKETEVGDACDTDGFEAAHTWVERVEDDSTGLYWLEISSHVPDSLLDEGGELIEGIDHDNIEFENDTAVLKFYVIMDEWSIGRVNLSEAEVP